LRIPSNIKRISGSLLENGMLRTENRSERKTEGGTPRIENK